MLSLEATSAIRKDQQFKGQKMAFGKHPAGPNRRRVSIDQRRVHGSTSAPSAS
jgi:hypothetical protein